MLLYFVSVINKNVRIYKIFINVIYKTFLNIIIIFQYNNNYLAILKHHNTVILSIKKYPATVGMHKN